MTDHDADEGTRFVWRRGSYEIVGDWFSEASRSVLQGDAGQVALDGLSLLDVACGTGAVAIAAALRGAKATGLDISPEMLAIAERRAEAAAVEIDLIEGSFDALGTLGSFDVVTSAFGVMFSTDPLATSEGLASIVAEEGLVSIAAWHPEGAFGSLPSALLDHLPSGGIDPSLWSDPDVVSGFFSTTPLRVRSSTAGSVAIPFASPAAAVSAMLRFSGPWMSLFDHLEALGEAERAEQVLVEHLEERSDPTPAGIALRADFVVNQLVEP